MGRRYSSIETMSKHPRFLKYLVFPSSIQRSRISLQKHLFSEVNAEIVTGEYVQIWSFYLIHSS